MVWMSKSAAGALAKSSFTSPLTDSPSICAFAAAPRVADSSPDTVLNRARDTVPSVKWASPLTVVSSMSAFPPVNTILPLMDFTSITFAAFAVRWISPLTAFACTSPPPSALILPLTVRSSKPPCTAETFRSELTSVAAIELLVGT